MSTFGRVFMRSLWVVPLSVLQWIQVRARRCCYQRSDQHRFRFGLEPHHHPPSSPCAVGTSYRKRKDRDVSDVVRFTREREHHDDAAVRAVMCKKKRRRLGQVRPWSVQQLPSACMGAKRTAGAWLTSRLQTAAEAVVHQVMMSLVSCITCATIVWVVRQFHSSQSIGVSIDFGPFSVQL